MSGAGSHGGSVTVPSIATGGRPGDPRAAFRHVCFAFNEGSCRRTACRSGTYAAPAVEFTHGTNASNGGLPDPSPFPPSLLHYVVLSDSDITRSSLRLTVRVPTDVLEFLLLGFEENCANRLILDSLTFFPIGGCGLPAGRPTGT